MTTPKLPASIAAATAADDDDDLQQRVEAAIALLESLVDDRTQLAALDRATRKRLLIATGRVARPGPWAKRQLLRAARRRRTAELRASDEQRLAATGIRSQRAAGVFATPAPRLRPPVPAARLDPAIHQPSLPDSDGDPPARTDPPAGSDANAVPDPQVHVHKPRNCYICKRDYTELHHFYASLCRPCGEFNFDKRTQTADLTGRIALLTGGRVKIGYQAAILLLRAGARVVVTTRFPRDAAARFAREADAGVWGERLDIYGLDLRHTPSVEEFARHLDGTLDRLDFILSNACQTVRRPVGFYQHLMEAERAPLEELSPFVRDRLAGYATMRTAALGGGDDGPVGLTRRGVSHRDASNLDAPALSQVPLLGEDLTAGHALFPAGQLDADLQQVDLRGRNSWRLALDEVSAIELLEVQLVNAVAPFILNARLKRLMLRCPSRDKHIVNVSAMEGQFYRNFKTDRHPHTNMAKAALNMLTRTSAADYVKDGIHMNSVDTGWVTDEDPVAIAARKTAEHGFHPPLDIVDGAARIVDPIFHGFTTGEHVWGRFLKDYAPTDW